ncbi:SYF2 splicing factor-domain-containing protein [Phyllosticta citribraziliensis]|uniref:Pre-mRNA-splicing factor SYF2 n=1 Tax=Phyllosticta citribraziliensis TaxID=989973 RepID=A0ABR1LSA5_9PEZI
MPSEKRKTTPESDIAGEQSSKRRFIETDPAGAPETNETQENADSSENNDSNEPTAASSSSSSAAPSTASNDRLARFKALQARQAASRKQNLKDSSEEARRATVDPAALSSLKRKHAVASHNLLKAETADSGEDFERKRAWDWTVEESERWDRRVEKKEKHRAGVAFADYRADARKTYKRQLRDLPPDLDGYERQKMQAIERAARSGGLEIVEMEGGELIAVDKDGSFYSTADSTDFVNHRPDKEGVDRLVGAMKKAEEQRLKARRARGINDAEDAGDVTYINQKNKQFNDKLARFYNKYTADIRESFERGTAL